ncbi:MAG: type I phosphomannose isomerase catalytic subunit [Oscillospiraceae bacterium]
MYAMKLKPTFKDYLWGGEKLKRYWGKKTEINPLAESWELSCHKDGNSIITTGEYANSTLIDYIKAEGKDVLGSACERFSDFPILIKLIDAKENLSVQVHPDDEYALRVEGEMGKTEMWYILDCTPDAKLFYGFKQEITKEELKANIENNTLTDVLNEVPVKKGDVFFIKAGTVHAIGAGILLAEIQQNSNTTYRVYDYGRVGADGQPRQLHIEKAMEVATLTKPTVAQPDVPIEKDGYTFRLLSKCEYFTTVLIDVTESATLQSTKKSFHSLLCIDGRLKIESEHGNMTIQKSDSVFLPADYGEYKLVGEGKVIVTYEE